jgi:hypothetical protein
LHRLGTPRNTIAQYIAQNKIKNIILFVTEDTRVFCDK